MTFDSFHPSASTGPGSTGSPRRVLVLGGTGFVGQSFCEQWTRAMPSGSTLLVPTRRPARANAIRHLPGVVVVEQADIHDETVLRRLVTGCDAIVNLVAILQGTPQAFEHAHVALPARLVQACAAAGVNRLVQVSALGVSPHAPSNYLRSKAAGESALQALGGALTILRPSVIFGARDRFLNTFAKLQALAPFVPLGGAHATFQPVWVEDVAKALVHSLLHPQRMPRLLECVGPEVYTLADLVRLAGQWSGHPRPVLALPGPLATLQALAMEALPGEPLMSRDNLASMEVPNVASGQLPGLDAIGISPASLRAIGPTYLSPGQGCARLDALRARAGRR
ncbi:MAG: complex I NDUFA9 subunit family protein [Betaproteobacteria bacterium]|nr:complex I NDUFA9 subunit family protein [Betaproteobacteria bacterium]NBT11399.1 complex I NDUFA9 subunit family protein [Betaproteobacteria bacterium]NBX95721.1 complex I NDUFA9 subunit family protein [Betaproteobacteria bacterium]